MDNFKDKIINRILREGLNYREVKDSQRDLNGDDIYSYEYVVTYENYEYVGGQGITAPSSSVEPELSQVYKLAHELGHHFINAQLPPIILRSYVKGNKILTFFIEILAWNKAKEICNEELIQITPIFNKVMLRGLFSYSRGLMRLFISIINNLVRDFACLFLFLSVINNIFSVNATFDTILQMSVLLFIVYTLSKKSLVMISK